ncbi:hypothetical protein STEPF1_02495 [Streptomyces sp. F-1]|nr:hypothetical protein STEPF1_02495 [Streptomyces sp. F-1]
MRPAGRCAEGDHREAGGGDGLDRTETFRASPAPSDHF